MKTNLSRWMIILWIASAGFIAGNTGNAQSAGQNDPYLIILGHVQDAGSPQIGCQQACCKKLHNKPDPSRMRTSLGIVDPTDQKRFLIEATPDITRQCEILNTSCNFPASSLPDAILITHAHIGHYSGLMYLGKEAIDAKLETVYVLPRMADFLRHNGPWDQLVNRQNITLREMKDSLWIKLTAGVSIMPFTVPHRDEYSETAGFLIRLGSKQILFIPDIDKWEKWPVSIIDLLHRVDYALLDGTFFNADELLNRDIRQVPHPVVEESMQLFESLSASDKNKVWFIHFNHTNPLINQNGKASRMVRSKGYHIARLKDTF